MSLDGLGGSVAFVNPLTVLAGGRGSYFGTMAGALVLTMTESLLRAMRMGEAYQLIVFGAILVILLSVYGRQRTNV